MRSSGGDGQSNFSQQFYLPVLISAWEQLPSKIIMIMLHVLSLRAIPCFRLILIAEKDTVYEKFPTPLINRLEKHFVLTSSILEGWQETVLGEFKQWITDFSSARLINV